MMMEERGGRKGGEPVKVFALDRSTDSLSPTCRRESRVCGWILTSRDWLGA